jgi:hypothetical protein
LRKNSGIVGNTIDDPAIAKAGEELGRQFNTIFEGTKKMALDPKTKANMVSAIEELIDTGSKFGKDSMLMRTYQVLTKSGVSGVSPKAIHSVWKEIGEVAENPQAAAKARGALEDMIEKGLSPEKLKEYQNLRKTWGNLEDVKRIWNSGGGGGQGKGSGNLSAFALKRGIGEGPYKGTLTDQAGGLAEQLAIPEATGHGLAPSSPSLWGAGSAAVQRLGGPVINFLDLNAMNTSPSTKFLLEQLRKRGAAAGTGAILRD